jgi:hypothetical protein
MTGHDERRDHDSNGEIVVCVDRPLLAALDRFIIEQDGKPTRSDAVLLILKDLLIGYGLVPLEAPPPIKQDAH